MIAKLSHNLLTAVIHALILVSAICLMTAGGASQTGVPDTRLAATSLRDARSTRLSAEQRAANYLRAAQRSAPLIGDGTQPTPARTIYNEVTAELAVLLRFADGGRLWNRPLTLRDGRHHLAADVLAWRQARRLVAG